MSAAAEPKSQAEHAGAPAAEQPPGPLRRLAGLLFDDLRTKAMALVFAVLVWVYINNEITTETTLSIPVRVESSSASVMVTDVEPLELALQVTGPREKIALLQGKTLARSLSIVARDLPEDEETRGIERPAEAFFQLPPGIAVGRKPPRVRITLVRAITRSLPVVRLLVGQPAPGYEVKSFAVEPTEVRIRGPITVLKKLSVIRTQPIRIAGREAGTIRKFVDVQDRVDGERLFYMEERPVFVRIEIGPRTVRETRRYTKPILLLMPATFPYSVKLVGQREVTVVLTGPQAELEAVARALRIIVDLDQHGTKLEPDHWKGTKYKLSVDGLPPGFEAKVLAGKDPLDEVFIELLRK